MKNFIILILLLCTGCVAKVSTHGFVDNEKVKEIKQQKSDRGDVLQALGSPSTTSMIDGENWYYISSLEKGYAFFKPSIYEQNATVISFNKKGIVSEVKQYDMEDSNDIKIAQDKTSTAQKDMSLVEQLLGNLGKFNSAKAK